MEPQQFDPATDVPLEELRTSGLEAYARFYSAVKDAVVLDRPLAVEVFPEHERRVTRFIGGLPAPVDTLPLWVISALAVHTTAEVPEWFRSRRGEETKLHRDYLDGQLTLLRTWLERHHSELEYLLLLPPPGVSEPWRDWTPEPAAGGGVDIEALLRRAEQAAEPLFSDRDVGTVTAFLLLRDWHEDLAPLLAALAIEPATVALLQLRHRLEELRQVVGGSKAAPPKSAVRPSRRPLADELRSRRGTIVERYRSRLDSPPPALRPDSAWGVLLGLPREWIAGAPALAEALADEQRVLAALREAAEAPSAAPGYRPSATVTRDYWTVEDNLGYGIYADAIAEFIRHEDTRPPLTIGIKAAWGAGKTSLMRMVRERLDPGANAGAHAPVRLRRPRRRLRVTNFAALRHTAPERGGAGPPSAFEPPPQEDRDRQRTSAWFNPWVYQSGEHLWAGLAQAIIDGVTGRMSRIERERFWFELNLARIDRARVRQHLYRLLFWRVLPLAFLALALLAVGAGVLLLAPALAALVPAEASLAAAAAAAAGAAVRAGRFLHASVEGSFDELVHQPDYDGSAGTLHLVQADVRRVLHLVATPGRPLVVFIDDLDRCSADVVGEVIEALNLFLAGQYPNCVFVLALEPDVVAAHLEAGRADLLKVLSEHLPEGTHFGMGWRFLDKMVQLPLRLPAPEARQLDGYIDSLLGARREQRRLDGEAVRRRAERLRAELPSIEDLRGAAAAVEDAEHGGTQPGGDAGDGQRPPLDEETIRAAEEAVADRLRDDAPEVRELIGSYADLLTRNPRDVKRFVNLFRFYAFVQVRRQLRDLPAPSLAQVGKMAILAIRWPYLLSVLGLTIPGDRETRVLAALERAAAGDDGTWTSAVEEAGLKEQMRNLIAADPDLRRVLSGEPTLAGVIGFL